MVVAGFVLRRWRAAPRRWLPGALGVAVALAGFMVAVVVPSMAGDVALRAEIRELAGADRLVSVVAANRDPALDQPVDALVRARLHDRGFDDFVRQTALRELASIDGTLFQLVGVDHLANEVVVQQGRLPQRCDRDACEVVLWARDGAPTQIGLDPALHVTVVGTVRRTDDRLLAGPFAPADREVVMLSDGATSPGNVRALELIQRTTGWITSLVPERLTVARVPTLLRDLATLGGHTDLVELSVKGPDAQLQAIARRAAVTTHRLALPVGQAGTLLGGFAILTTLAIRPWHRRGLRVLQLRAVARRQEWSFAALEAAAVIVVGTVFGIILASVVVSGLASAASIKTTTALSRLARHGPIGATAALVLGYWLVTVALLRSGTKPPRSARRVWVSDVIGVAAIAVWVLAASRGSTSINALASGGDSLLSVTPALASIAATCVVIRLVPLVRSLARRLTPMRRWPTRLALVNALGHGARPLATAAFVASAMTLASFALGYRTTLQASTFDQAAFRVPLDFTVREGSALVRPQTVTDTSAWEGQEPTVTATDVLRRGLAGRTRGTAVDTGEVVGVDPRVVDQLRGWRRDFGRRPTSASLVVPTPPPDGVAFTPGSTELAIHVSSPPPNLGVGAVVERADGTWHEIEALPSTSGAVWTARLEPQDVRWHGLRIGESAISTAHTLHNLGEGAGTDVASLAIHIGLSDLTVDHRPVAVDWATLHGSEGQLTPAPDHTDLTLVVHADSSLFLLGNGTIEPIPAIVDPVTASTARGGVVTLETSGRGTIAVRVAGTATRFPTVGSRFAVVDETALSRRLDRTQPGSGAPNEVWLAAADDHARQQLALQLAGDRFGKLDVTSRQKIEGELSGNTLGRAVIAVFLWSSLVAAFLGAIALIFLTHAERIDGLPVLRSLSADGATSRQLVTILLVRGLVLVVTAAPVGAAAGIILLRAVRQLVNVSANGTPPVPPLRTVIEPWQIATCIGAITALALGGAVLVGRGVRTIRRHEALAAPA